MKKLFLALFAALGCVHFACAEVTNYSFTSNADGVVTLWGAIYGADPKTNLHIDIVAGDDTTVMGTVELNDVDGIYAANTTGELTWHMMVLGEEYDNYWSTTWHTGYPNRDDQPAKAHLYVDGELVHTSDIKMSGADDLNPVVWKELFVAEVAGTIYGSLQKAIDATTADQNLVKLLCDTKATAALTIAEDKTVTLDLGGNTVTGSLAVEGALTLKNGKIDGGTDWLVVDEGGTVTLGAGLSVKPWDNADAQYLSTNPPYVAEAGADGWTEISQACATVMAADGTTSAPMSLKKALETAKTTTGDVVITLTAEETIDLSCWESVEMGGSQFASLTIDGNGATVTKLAQPLFSNMGLNPVTLKNATFTDLAITGNTSSGMVGAGIITAGTAAAQDITIEDVTVTGGTIDSENYGGVFVGYFQGHSTGDLVVKNGKISDVTINSVKEGGSIGAIAGHVDNGTATVRNTTIGGRKLNSIENGAYNEHKTGIVFGTANSEVVVKIDVTTTAPCYVDEQQITKLVGRLNKAATCVILGGSYDFDPTTVGTDKDSLSDIVPVTAGNTIKVDVDGELVQEDDKYIVHKAQVGEETYLTLAEALEKGDAVTLLGSVYEKVSTSGDKTLTLSGQKVLGLSHEGPGELTLSGTGTIDEFYSTHETTVTKDTGIVIGNATGYWQLDADGKFVGRPVMIAGTETSLPQYFDTLQAAFDAAKNGDTIKLLAEVTLEVVPTVTGKTVTIDVNGQKLTAPRAMIDSADIKYTNGFGWRTYYASANPNFILFPSFEATQEQCTKSDPSLVYIFDDWTIPYDFTLGCGNPHTTSGFLVKAGYEVTINLAGHTIQQNNCSGDGMSFFTNRGILTFIDEPAEDCETTGRVIAGVSEGWVTSVNPTRYGYGGVALTMRDNGQTTLRGGVWTDATPTKENVLGQISNNGTINVYNNGKIVVDGATIISDDSYYAFVIRGGTVDLQSGSIEWGEADPVYSAYAMGGTTTIGEDFSTVGTFYTTDNVEAVYVNAPYVSMYGVTSKFTLSEGLISVANWSLLKSDVEAATAMADCQPRPEFCDTLAEALAVEGVEDVYLFKSVEEIVTISDTKTIDFAENTTVKGVYVNGKGKLTLTGNGTLSILTVDAGATVEKATTVTVGSIPAGYVWTTSSTTETLTTARCQVGTDYYASVEEAIQALGEDGGTITILSDAVVWPTNFTLPEKVTIQPAEGVLLTTAPAGYFWDKGTTLTKGTPIAEADRTKVKYGSIADALAIPEGNVNLLADVESMVVLSDYNKSVNLMGYTITTVKVNSGAKLGLLGNSGTVTTLEVEDGTVVGKVDAITVTTIPADYYWSSGLLTKYAAQIDETNYYKTLKEAVQAALTAGGTVTVTLLKDVTEDVSFEATVMKKARAAFPETTLVLDLNEYTINGVVTIPAGKTVQITDETTHDEQITTLVVEAGAAVEIVGAVEIGTLKVEKPEGAEDGAVAQLKATPAETAEDAKPTIGTLVAEENATLELANDTDVTINGFADGATESVKPAEAATVKVNGEELTADSDLTFEPVAKIGDTAYVTLQAAIDAAQPGNTITLCQNETVATTVDKQVTIDLAGYMVSELTLTAAANVTFQSTVAEGDENNGTITTLNVVPGAQATKGAGVTITTLTGGEWDAAGNLAPYVAAIDKTNYSSLEAAHKAALAGNTITLLGDIAVKQSFDITKAITLDLNGYTLSKAADATDVTHIVWLKADGEGEMSITDSSTAQTGRIEQTGGSAIYYTGTARAIIKAGTFTGTDSVVRQTETGAWLEINGGIFVWSGSTDGMGTIFVETLANAETGTITFLNGGTYMKQTGDTTTTTGTLYLENGAQAVVMRGSTDIAIEPQNDWTWADGTMLMEATEGGGTSLPSGLTIPYTGNGTLNAGNGNFNLNGATLQMQPNTTLSLTGSATAGVRNFTVELPEGANFDLSGFSGTISGVKINLTGSLTDGRVVVKGWSDSNYGKYLPGAAHPIELKDVDSQDCLVPGTDANAENLVLGAHQFIYGTTYVKDGTTTTDTATLAEGCQCCSHLATAKLSDPEVDKPFTYNGNAFTATKTVVGQFLNGDPMPTYGLHGCVNAGWVAAFLRKGTAPSFSLYEIQRQPIQEPTLTLRQDLYYTGKEQTVAPSPDDADYIYLNNTGTAIGTYTLFVRLADLQNYQWADGTLGDKTYRWVIAESQAALAIAMAFEKPAEPYLNAAVAIDSFEVTGEDLVGTVSVDLLKGEQHDIVEPVTTIPAGAVSVKGSKDLKTWAEAPVEIQGNTFKAKVSDDAKFFKVLLNLPQVQQ